MAELSIQDLGKRYGDVEVLKNINLEARHGEFLVLLGPSGCGKSTLLNAIAGLDDISTGRILIDGRPVTDLEPKDRDIAMVFQSYALYPTMTVRKNIEFGMRVRGVKKPEREAAINRVADILQIGHLLDRKPGQLSGGQRQRVAMGRALVRSPKIFLFDEPLSNLDAKLRVEMRAEIKKLHQRLGATIVYVTHDQIEAMTLATKVAVMKGGIVQQVGTPDDIYQKPANLYVAGFIGSPPANLVPGHLTVSGGRALVTIDRSSAKFDLGSMTEALKERVGKNVIIGIRPESVSEVAGRIPAGYQTFDADVELIEPTGADTFLILSVGGATMTARSRPRSRVTLGRQQFQLNSNDILIFDPETELLIHSSEGAAETQPDALQLTAS
jgi:multiple sugar transport system ATP-binding protein